MNTDLKERMKTKIDNYFTNKYPETYPVIGLKSSDLDMLVEKTVNITNNKSNTLTPQEKHILLSQNLNNLISIIEKKIKTRIYSENRLNNTVNTNKYTMDAQSNIPYTDFSTTFNSKSMVGDLNVEKSNTLDSKRRNFNGLTSEELDQVMLSMTKDNDNNKINVSLQEGHISEIKDKLEENNILKLRNQELDLLYEEEREFNYNIVVDSKDRDYTKYPNPSTFVIDFSPPNGSPSEINNGYVNKAFGNIIKCELLDVILLDTIEEEDSTDSSGNKYPYLLLELNELGSNYEGTNDELSKSFAILTTYQNINGYKHYTLNSVNSDTTIKKIYNPRINLNRLTIKLKTSLGEVYNFGAVNNDNASTVFKLTFRITTLQKNLGTKFINKAIY